jgi:hypothetical protein
MDMNKCTYLLYPRATPFSRHDNSACRKLLPIAFGLGLLLFDEAKKYSVRRWPDGIAAKIAW